MNDDYRVINDLISTALFNNKINYPVSANWSFVYEEMTKQTISALVTDYLPKINGIDSTVKMQWRIDVIGQVNHFNEYLYEQDKVVKILTENKIPFVVIKGASICCDYSKPEYRAMGDIDLLTLPEYVEKADELLLNEDFLVKEKSDAHRHNTYIKDGCEIELHWSFDTISDDEKSKLDEFLFSGVKNAEWADLDGYSFPKLPVIQQGIVLLQHMKHHMRYGFGYRQFLDWLVFADKYLSTDLWSNSFEKTAKKFGLDKFAKTVTQTGKEYFNFNEDKFLWCKDISSQLCGEFMEYIINCGNMGRKLEENQKGLSKVMRSHTPLSLIKNLQGFGEKNWTALKKHKWLKPFAWLYQICRFVRIGLTNPNNLSLKRVAKDKQRKNRVEELCKKMGING